MPKRGNSEGSIYRRADGRWEAKITIGRDAGRLVRKSYYGDTRGEAAAKLTRAQSDILQGVPLQRDESLSVGGFLAQWLSDSVQPRVRPRTHELYSMVVRVHLAPQIGRIRLTRLTPQDVQKVLAKLSAAGLAPRTVRTVRSVLRQALQHALKWSLVPRNVAALVDVPRVTHEPISPYTLDEARQFLASIRGERLEALFTTAMLTGLRRGEVLGLRWVDVNLDSGAIRVTGALQRYGGALQRSEPKTQQSRREVAIPRQLVDALNAHRLRQLEERLKAGPVWDDAGYVFTTSIGTPIEPGNLTRTFARLVAGSGLRKQRFHDLRHCFATLQLENDTPARVVMEQLGHTQISTTLDIYSHVTQKLQRESADRLGALFAV